MFAAGIDVIALEKNLQSGDCAKLQDTLNGVAFCDPSLEFPEVGQMPPEMLKVFRIAQLTIQYLLHSQDMLTEGVQKLKAESFSIKRVIWMYTALDNS